MVLSTRFLSSAKNFSKIPRNNQVFFCRFVFCPEDKKQTDIRQGILNTLPEDVFDILDQ